MEWEQAEPFGEGRMSDEKFQEILCIVLEKGRIGQGRWTNPANFTKRVGRNSMLQKIIVQI